MIAAKAVSFLEALEPGFKEYQAQIRRNAAALADALTGIGWKLVSGGTDNHLIWCDLRAVISAMKPTPQESFSCAGSNKPKACAPIVVLALLAHPRQALTARSQFGASRPAPPLPSSWVCTATWTQRVPRCKPRGRTPR